MHRLRRTSPIREIQFAQFETLIKDKEGKHEGDCDETSLLTGMHGPALLTEMAVEISQLKSQLQKLTTIPLAKVHA